MAGSGVRFAVESPFRLGGLAPRIRYKADRYAKRITDIVQTDGVGELGVYQTDNMIPWRKGSELDVVLRGQFECVVRMNHFTKLAKYGMILGS
ncbi:MAG: hypothetical protein ACI9TH_005054 [Kiritimatiellia bacterium]|jgi:hypothetical protein